MSQHIRTWSDLVPFGIEYLTGEADPYSLRGLCDLSTVGADCIRDFLGFAPDAAMHRNWNTMVGGEPAVASVMLPKNILAELATYLLFSVGNFDMVVQYRGIVSGYRNGEVDRFSPTIIGDMRDNGALVQYNPRTGTRNVHAMTSRVV